MSIDGAGRWDGRWSTPPDGDLRAGRVVVVGGGQAALQVAVSLREAGFTGAITLIADESHLPYMRPPLSKSFLKGGTEAADLPLRVDSFFDAENIDLRRGVRAEAIDRAARTVGLTGGVRVTYDVLVLATGARVRRLDCPGTADCRVAYLRTLDDAHRIADALKVARRVAVIGGGFIGLEVAAIAAEMGKTVTVLEAGARLMARAVAPTTSDWYLALHRRHGVDVRLGAQMEALAGRDGEPRSVRLVGGDTVEADLIVAGIGVAANDELAQACGLATRDGIIVDAELRTSDPRIYAIGDCVRFPLNDRPMRLESIQNAVDQAKHVALALRAGARPYRCVPWFWSEQFGVKLQIAGLHNGFDAEHVVGGPDPESRSVEYYRHGQLIAVHSMNRPGDHLRARKALVANLQN